MNYDLTLVGGINQVRYRMRSMLGTIVKRVEEKTHSKITKSIHLYAIHEHIYL